MASAQRQPVTGVWGFRPERGPGHSPLVTGQGRGPLKLKALQPLQNQNVGQICTLIVCKLLFESLVKMESARSN